MAISKALQAQQWWAEIGQSTTIKCRAQPTWLERARWQTEPITGNVHEVYAETASFSADEFADQHLHLTAHAKLRLAQRNLSIDEINYVLLYGQAWHKAGAVINYLRRKDIPKADRADQRRKRLIGTTVVMVESKPTVLTAYRNPRSGLRRIKRKPNYGWH